MKLKWLVIISIVCIGIIFISFMLIKQTSEIIKVAPEKEITAPVPAMNYPQALSLPAPVNIVTKSTPPPKSAITIVSQPVVTEPQKEIPLANTASYENLSVNSETESNVQPGITKIGKHPSRKETQELQSRGIVLY